MLISFTEPTIASATLRYGVALLSVLTAALLTALLFGLLYPTVFILFFGAVFFSARLGGFKPGVVATFLSVAAAYLLFRRGPEGAVLFGFTRLLIFSLLALLMSWLVAALKRGSDVLREREEWFEDIFEGSREAIFLAETDARFLEVNRAACELTGYTRQELLSMRIPDLHDEENLRPFHNYFDSIMKGEDIVSEAYVRRKDGTQVPVEFSNRRMVFRGRPIMHTTARDVTKSKQAEEALAKSEIHLRAIVETEPECVKLIGKKGELLEMNPAGLAMIEAGSLDQVRNRVVTEIVAPEYRAQFSALSEKVFRGGSGTLEFEIIGLKGTRRWLETHAVPLRDQRGEVIAHLGVTRDITERKRAEESLLQQKEILQKIFDHIPAMVNFIDGAGVIKMVNREWERVTGWTNEELPGRDILAELYTDPEHRRYVLDFISSSTGEWRDFKTRIRSGEVRDTSWASVKLMDGMSIGIGQDVTDRKVVEKAREQLLKDRKQLLRRLVTAQEEERRRIARELHDQLGQQITALMLGLKWLKDSGHCRPPAAEHLGRLQEYADQLGREVHNIAWELRPTALDDLGLHTALGNYLEKWSEGSGKSVELHSNGFNGHRLSTQIETTLYRVIQEALTNVLKHAEAEFVSLILERRGNHVLAIIEDNGRGFNVEAVMSAPESERKLGLLGMRERLALIFGTLDIESTPGAGTTLFVRIPTPPLESESTAP